MSVVALFEKQLVLFDYFYEEDREIFFKYSNRWSALLWNCCVASASSTALRSLIAVKCASYCFRLCIASKSAQTEETMNLLCSRLLSLSQNLQYSSSLAPLFELLFSSYSGCLSLDSCLSNPSLLVRAFRFYLAWTRVNPSAAQYKSFMNAVTRRTFTSHSSQVELNEDDTIANRDLLYLMKVIHYFREIASILQTQWKQTRRDRVQHDLSTSHLIAKKYLASLVMTESTYLLFIECWQYFSFVQRVLLPLPLQCSYSSKSRMTSHPSHPHFSHVSSPCFLSISWLTTSRDPTQQRTCCAEPEFGVRVRTESSP